MCVCGGEGGVAFPAARALSRRRRGGHGPAASDQMMTTICVLTVSCDGGGGVVFPAVGRVNTFRALAGHPVKGGHLLDAVRM